MFSLNSLNPITKLFVIRVLLQNLLIAKLAMLILSVHYEPLNHDM